MDKPLFADVSHALHVSYLVLSMPPRQKAPFRNMLIQLLEAIDEPTAAQEKWLAELRGPQGDFDPDRLSMDEYRAQYAMITDAAKTRLPTPEYAAVLARYGHGEEKLAGCKRLALYARRACGMTALALLLDLVIRHYLPKEQREDYTLRAIAEKRKVTKDKVFRAAKWMEANFRSLELMALQRLEPSFVAHGLVPDRTACEEAAGVAT
ncbi:hypothetical protein ACUXAV_000667 [Cupriavidus metallidurans]|jgi:hypothetical protein|uniref:hypothetical protein n=1 Tax=Cupriavidus TaxID=106589 RepID=UPI00046B7341|nr:MULTISPECIES: hypothetical protein [Cupriavidus]KWR79048.1 hypothetical protein RN01_22665 [Cupriavidus sp. SHE]MDE4918568.1 hypothetical protein [Cupriavidus metallidurans]